MLYVIVAFVQLLDADDQDRFTFPQADPDGVTLPSPAKVGPVKQGGVRSQENVVMLKSSIAASMMSPVSPTFVASETRTRKRMVLVRGTTPSSRKLLRVHVGALTLSPSVSSAVQDEPPLLDTSK